MINFNGLRALEIGGPSNPFNNIYGQFAQVDGINFSDNTMWQGQQVKGPGGFKYNGRVGDLYICDAVDLSIIESNSYDVILSSHSLEHIANPLKALKDWIRVLRNPGYMLIIVPAMGAGDWKRPDTTFEHLLEDYNNQVGEDDLTHWPEMEALYDLSKDPYAGTPEQFKARCLDNVNNRSMHHHIFSLHSMAQIGEFLNLKILSSERTSEGFQVLYQV
jgi:SAM-dependent methyltransferase